MEVPSLELDQHHRAGDVVGFPGGQVSYLAPLPLPTGQPAQDYAYAVGEVNDTYLDFGVGLPPVFGWQLTLGGGIYRLDHIRFFAPYICSIAGFPGRRNLR